jgi:hypothetical protein
MLYPVIGASIKFNLIFLPRIFTSFTNAGSVDGERPLPHRWAEAEARGAVKDAERGAERREAGFDP